MFTQSEHETFRRRVRRTGTLSQSYRRRRTRSSARQPPSWAQVPEPLISASQCLLTSISPGTDTTSVALTYIAWELARNKGFRKELRRELTNVPEHKRGDVDTLKALPYLNAFLRVRCPGAGSI